MNLHHKTTVRSLTSAIAAAALTMGMSANAGLIFFGEDLIPGETVPAGGAAETARNAFLSSLQGVGTETFEGIAGDTSANGLVLNFPGSTGNITATQSTTSGSPYISDSSGAGRFATSGTNFLQEVTSGFSVSFGSEIAAFGFYGTDIGDFNGQVTLEITGNNAPQTFNVGNTINAPNGSLLFWGFIADAGETFTSVAFGNTAAGSDVFGFDDLTIGELGQVVPPSSDVPVPGTLTLLALGLGLAGFGAGRKKKA